jgi:hypothetical protein
VPPIFAAYRLADERWIIVAPSIEPCQAAITYSAVFTLPCALAALLTEAN